MGTALLVLAMILLASAMELPALFYGLYRNVKPRATRIINRIRKGADWMALVEAEGFLDVAKTPGMILLDGPNPHRGGEQHFQAWLLWGQMLVERHLH